MTYRPQTASSLADATRIGVDIGGTFTDVVLEKSGRRWTAKVLTTPRAPEDGVVTGLEEVLAQARLCATDVDLIIHGTTLATNAIIERKGARIAFLTTRGFRDVLQLRYEDRFDQYDLTIELPEPLVPRRLRLPVPERTASDGTVLEPLDEPALLALLPTLDEAGVEAVAVGFLHSYACGRHEERVRELLTAHRPHLSVSLSCEVSPEIREFERFSTTCANAYVQPLMDRYLGRLEELLARRGFTCPVLMMLSGGGLTTIETARRFPIRLVESGPAAGAVFAAHLARERDLGGVLSFDMGGTTAKLCLIDDGRPQTSRSFEVARVWRFRKGSGLPLRIPVVEMVEIGAGGGSIARLDSMGMLAVGPESSGAEPGPACFGRGGRAPTVTDADLVLGRLDAERFSNGRIALDEGAARAAVADVLGGRLGLDATRAAAAVSEVVDENMANAARVHAAESGKVLAGRTVVAFGGAAPLHAMRVAQKLGIERVIVPYAAGVGSAVGFLRSPIGYEIARSAYRRLDDLDAPGIVGMLDQMCAEAEAIVRRAAPDAPLTVERIAYMRYVGQGHEVAVPIPAEADASRLSEALSKGFAKAYGALFGRTLPNATLEALTWSVAVGTRPPEPTPMRTPPVARDAPPIGERSVFDTVDQSKRSVPVFWRTDLRPGDRIRGPAIVAEAETSTLVAASWTVFVDDGLALDCRLTPRNGPGASE